MGQFFENPETWVLVAFIIFVGLVSKKAYLKIAVALDARASRIKDELDDATRLREEAQGLLSKYEQQQRDVVQETEQIVSRARRDSELMVKEAKERLEEQLVQREKQALQNINRAETQLVKELRSMSAEMAVRAAETLIKDNLGLPQAQKLIDNTIAELPVHLKPR